MSSGLIKKDNQNLKKKSLNNEEETNFYTIAKLVSDVFKFKNEQDIIGISGAIVPFSNLSPNPRNAYSGKSNIVFKELDPIFKKILRQEFADAINDLSKQNLILRNC